MWKSESHLRTVRRDPLRTATRQSVGWNSTEQGDLDKDARRPVTHCRIRFFQATAICELEWEEIDEANRIGGKGRRTFSPAAERFENAHRSLTRIGPSS